MRKMPRLGLSLLAGAALVLAACGGDDGGGGDAAATKKVVDGLGHEVELPTDPQRVFGMYTTDLDYALALGLGVAPTQAIRTGSVGLPEFFPQDEVEGMEFFVNYPEINFEKVASIKPDLIINGLGYEGGPDVTRMQDIAPTYSFNGFGGDWRDDLTALGAALGREDEAKAYLARIDARTAEVEQAMGDRSTPLVAAYGYFNGDGSGGFYGPQLDNLPPVVFDDLGIKTSAVVTDVWTEVAQEQIGSLSDVDLLMIAVETDTDPEATLAQLRADPVWSSLPAVQKGQVVTVNNELSYSSPSAHLEFLDVLEAALAKVPAS